MAHNKALSRPDKPTHGHSRPTALGGNMSTLESLGDSLNQELEEVRNSSDWDAEKWGNAHDAFEKYRTERVKHSQDSYDEHEVRARGSLSSALIRVYGAKAVDAFLALEPSVKDGYLLFLMLQAVILRAEKANNIFMYLISLTTILRKHGLELEEMYGS